MIWVLFPHHRERGGWASSVELFRIISDQMPTWAGKRDSPGHFLSSQAFGSMLDPPKLAACVRAIDEKFSLFFQYEIKDIHEWKIICWNNEYICIIWSMWWVIITNIKSRYWFGPQRCRGAGGWSSCRGRGAGPAWWPSPNPCTWTAALQRRQSIKRMIQYSDWMELEE